MRLTSFVCLIPAAALSASTDEPPARGGTRGIRSFSDTDRPIVRESGAEVAR